MENSEQLRELYHHDRRLAFIERRLQEIPAALRALGEEVARQGEVGRRRDDEAAELAEALRRLERESAVLRGELARLAEQQKAVTDMDALRASEHQLEHCRARLATVEDTLLVKLEAQEIHSREGALRARREGEERSALDDECRALDDERRECEQEQAESLAAREALLEAMADADARRYRRIFSSHGHRTLAPLRGGGCGGCGAALPPQELVEVKSQGRVIPCQGCGRLVLRVEEES